MHRNMALALAGPSSQLAATKYGGAAVEPVNLMFMAESVCGTFLDPLELSRFAVTTGR